MKWNKERSECIPEFAKAVCKIKGWKEDDGFFDLLINAIEGGLWSEQMSFWIEGRQSILDEFKARVSLPEFFTNEH